MTEAAPEPSLTSSFGTQSRPKTRSQRFAVREARPADAAGVAVGIGELLVELGGEGPSPAALVEATRELAGRRDVGALLLAEAGEGGDVIGVLAASWQFAIHVPGRYGTIQDLWVHSSWRSRAVGRELMAALFDLAREEGAKRVEVGLPRDDFPKLKATEGFYLANGFVALGPRMRRVL